MHKRVMIIPNKWNFRNKQIEDLNTAEKKSGKYRTNEESKLLTAQEIMDDVCNKSEERRRSPELFRLTPEIIRAVDKMAESRREADGNPVIRQWRAEDSIRVVARAWVEYCNTVGDRLGLASCSNDPVTPDSARSPDESSDIQRVLLNADAMQSVRAIEIGCVNGRGMTDPTTLTRQIRIAIFGLSGKNPLVIEGNAYDTSDNDRRLVKIGWLGPMEILELAIRNDTELQKVQKHVDSASTTFTDEHAPEVVTPCDSGILWYESQFNIDWSKLEMKLNTWYIRLARLIRRVCGTLRNKMVRRITFRRKKDGLDS